MMTLHTHSEKLQREIIAQDMDLKKVLATACSIELTDREIAFMKQHNIEATASPTPVYAVQGKHPKAEHLFKSKGKTIEICRYCGERTPHKGKCKAMSATCKSCNKKKIILLVFVSHENQQSQSKRLTQKKNLMKIQSKTVISTTILWKDQLFSSWMQSLHQFMLSRARNDIRIPWCR